MRYAAASLALLLLASGAACGERVTDQSFVLGLLGEVDDQSHEFEYREVVDGREFVARGRVEDDFRREAVLSIDGKDAVHAVISDDALAVRLIDQALVEGLDLLSDRVAADALREGRWVIDHTAAPPLFPPTTSEGSIAIGLGPILDSTYAVAYLRRAIEEGFEVEEHNPDEPTYQPADDPFSEITEREYSRSQGYRRFDVVPPGLPSPIERGTEAAVPAPRQFRKLSFFVRGEQIVKVLEEISFERREFRRAREGRESEFYLRLLESVRAGGTLEPVRLRTMVYDVADLGGQIRVDVPLTEAVAGSLAGFLELMEDRPEEPVGGLPDIPVPVG